MGDFKKKFIATGITLVIVVCVLAGGTYAWRDENQHKTNVVKGKGKFYDVTLIEDFKPVDDWKITDKPKKKEIRVKNDGEDKAPVYIRLSLKEFMEISRYQNITSDENLMIDSKGQFVSFKSQKEAEDYVLDHQLENKIIELKKKDENSSNFYLEDELGMPLLLDVKILPAEPLEELVAMYPDIKNHSYEALESHNNQEGNKECDGYPVHEWDRDKIHQESPFSQYVTWEMGSDVITLDEYLKLIEGKDVKDWGVDKWILDTSSLNGYVYWGNPLESGAVTSDLLKSVSLIKQPSGQFFYEVHVDMESTDHKGLSEWTQLPESLKQAWNVK